MSVMMSDPIADGRERAQPRAEAHVCPIPRLTRILFGSGLICLALVGFRFGDFAGVLQELPTWVPARAAIMYVAAAVMLLGGIGLLLERTAALSARLVFAYLTLWVVLLDLPIALRAPLVLGNWSNMAEITALLAGGWVLFATLDAPADRNSQSLTTGTRGVRLAQILFGLSLPLLGLAHFVYLDLTAPLVPAWLPYHTAWAYITGAAQIAAGIAVLLSIRARLAATLEAVMLTAFTILVWIPAVIAKPAVENGWSELALSWAISAGAWVVAASMAPGDDRLGQP